MFRRQFMGIVISSAILPWPKRIRSKMSDKKHYVNSRDYTSISPKLSLYPGGASTLYLRRTHDGRLVLSVEQRAAFSIAALALDLHANDDRLPLQITADKSTHEPPDLDPAERIVKALAAVHTPIPLTEIREACRIRREAKLDGKWVVTSNDNTLSAEDLAFGYKQLMRVEECWHTVKGGLRTRPIFHWTPHRICAQVSLCVLALLLERIAEIHAGDTWRNIRDQLETIKMVEYERGGVRVQQTTELRPTVVTLLGHLKVELRPKIQRVTPGEMATPAEAAVAKP